MSEQMVSESTRAAFSVPSMLLGSTYYVSGAVTGVSLGLLRTAANMIESVLCDRDQLEIELIPEDLHSIVSDAGLDFTLCPPADSQQQASGLSHTVNNPDTTEEETPPSKDNSYGVLQQELDCSKHNLASAHEALVDARDKATQVQAWLHRLHYLFVSSQVPCDQDSSGVYRNSVAHTCLRKSSVCLLAWHEQLSVCLSVCV